ncbi:hypothetical protein CCMA1212_007412 [Trichoderma ghanense]|uniref:Uncharacterized protein n=1 Tax=Trichoderma ghanense TaxID=65468 RepID=A0ABY2H0K6_9HYPO
MSWPTHQSGPCVASRSVFPAHSPPQGLAHTRFALSLFSLTLRHSSPLSVFTDFSLSLFNTRTAAFNNLFAILSSIFSPANGFHHSLGGDLYHRPPHPTSSEPRATSLCLTFPTLASRTKQPGLSMDLAAFLFALSQDCLLFTSAASTCLQLTTL